MAMVISSRAKGVIIGILGFMIVGAVLVAGSTKGWFGTQRYYGDGRTAARIQVNDVYHIKDRGWLFNFI